MEEGAKSFVSLEFNRHLLADFERNKKFHDALIKVVTKDSIIIDIGSGTGFLSFLAIKLGAKECYLYEEEPELFQLSKNIGEANSFKNCKYFNYNSLNEKKPPLGDIVISETLGSFAFDEGIITNLGDGMKFLEKGGKLIPCDVKQWIAPVIGDSVYKELFGVWDEISNLYKIDFSFAKSVTEEVIVFKKVPEKEVEFSKTLPLDYVNFNESNNSSKRTNKVIWNINQSLKIYGFCIWWEATLIPGVILSTIPSVTNTHWDQVYVPIKSPISCQENDLLEFFMDADFSEARDPKIAWSISLTRANDLLFSIERSQDFLV